MPSNLSEITAVWKSDNSFHTSECGDILDRPLFVLVCILRNSSCTANVLFEWPLMPYSNIDFHELKNKLQLKEFKLLKLLFTGFNKGLVISHEFFLTVIKFWYSTEKRNPWKLSKSLVTELVGGVFSYCFTSCLLSLNRILVPNLCNVFYLDVSSFQEVLIVSFAEHWNKIWIQPVYILKTC